jgi:hypothetical protein
MANGPSGSTKTPFWCLPPSVLLEAWRSSNSSTRVSFSETDYLAFFRRLGEAELLELFLFKYRDWSPPMSGDLVHAASALADRCTVSPVLGDFLFRVRRNRELSFPEWFTEFKTTQIINHLFNDAFVMAQVRNRSDKPGLACLERFLDCLVPARYVNVSKTEELFRSLDVSNGLLLSTFHGGFLTVVRALFDTMMPEHYTMVGERTGRSGQIVTKSGRHGSAFRAVKALREKKAVLVASDITDIAEVASTGVNLVGMAWRFPNGAPVIAYEANCATGWYSVRRKGNEFVPYFVEGPRRIPGEGFDRFKERWFAFYAARIESALTGEPESLSLQPVWFNFWFNFCAREHAQRRPEPETTTGRR